jgi:hypothetical protein
MRKALASGLRSLAGSNGATADVVSGEAGVPAAAHAPADAAPDDEVPVMVEPRAVDPALMAALQQQMLSGQVPVVSFVSPSRAACALFPCREKVLHVGRFGLRK